MKTVIKVHMGTNKINGSKLLKRDFSDLSWWSDNLETLAHYYEGMAIEITVELDSEKEYRYVREPQDLDFPLSEYTYGVAEVGCPKGAIWYSFSGEYLRNHIVSIAEIFPDLSAFNEE